METYLKRIRLVMEENPTNYGVNTEKFTSSKDSADFFKILMGDSIDIYETFLVAFLDQQNKPKAWFKVSSGGINMAIVDIRVLMSTALNCLATNMIICHNHPSGNLQPSQQDLAITKKIQKACDILDIKFLDHVIITKNNGYYSFADEGQI